MHPQFTPSDITRYWSHVDRAGNCWRWLASTGRYGYGQFGTMQGGRVRMWRAHRVAWIITHGLIPDGLFVCHNCPGGDNPACVNPSHLFLGDHAGNMSDMVAKGRSAAGQRSGAYSQPDRRTYGERNGQAKLTDAQVATIRLRYTTGVVSQRTLADDYGVCTSTVSRIISHARRYH